MWPSLSFYPDCDDMKASSKNCSNFFKVFKLLYKYLFTAIFDLVLKENFIFIRIYLLKNKNNGPKTKNNVKLIF